MPILQSIEPLVKENIIATQNRPIIVHCSDLNYYFCKYHIGHGSAYRLLKEYLISSFLELWHFNHAECNLIEVLPEHIPQGLGIPNRCFLTPCFGSKKIEDVVMLSKLNENILLRPKGKQTIKNDIFKISFFDMLFANEDRHLNNYNLLVGQKENEYIIFPIDHEACFNHQNIDREMVPLTYEETLIYSPLFHKLFNNYDLINKKELDNTKDKYYLCFCNCVKKIDEILVTIPNSWQVNVDQVSERLKSYLTDDWFKECWHEFLIYIQYFLSNTH